MGEGTRDNCDAEGSCQDKNFLKYIASCFKDLAKAKTSRILNTLPKVIAVPWYV